MQAAANLDYMCAWAPSATNLLSLSPSKSCGPGSSPHSTQGAAGSMNEIKTDALIRAEAEALITAEALARSIKRRSLSPSFRPSSGRNHELDSSTGLGIERGHLGRGANGVLFEHGTSDQGNGV